MTLKRMVGILALCACTSLALANPSDSEVTSSIQQKISAENALNGTTINVQTTNGIVHLSGNVESDAQADTATEIAQSTPGATDVNTSKLTVKGSNHPVRDAIITAKVKGMFIQQKLFGDKDIAPMSIKVETHNGVVSLSGNVDNQEQKNNAIKIAKEVVGVKKVKSTIKISNS